MEGVVRLDTHVVVWLYAGQLDRISPTGLAAIKSADLAISPMVQLELTYLHEIGRLRVSGAEVVNDLSNRLPLTISDQQFRAVAQAAASLSWTRDPFDRLIVADCLAANGRLLTKDQTIRANTSLAFW